MRMVDVGKQIKKFRMKKDMTQDELAEKLFVSRQTISNYENSKSQPDIEVLVQLAEIFETDVNTLICGDEQSLVFKRKIKRYILKICIILLCAFFLVILQDVLFRWLHWTGDPIGIFVKFTEWVGLESHEAYNIQVHMCFLISVYNFYLIHPVFAVFSGYHVVDGLGLLQRVEHLKWKYTKYLRRTVQGLLAFYCIIMLPGWLCGIVDEISYFRWMRIKEPGYWSSSSLEISPIWSTIKVKITHFMVNYQKLSLAVFFILGAIWGITKLKRNKE